MNSHYQSPFDIFIQKTLPHFTVHCFGLWLKFFSLPWQSFATFSKRIYYLEIKFSHLLYIPNPKQRSKPSVWTSAMWCTWSRGGCVSSPITAGPILPCLSPHAFSPLLCPQVGCPRAPTLNPLASLTLFTKSRYIKEQISHLDNNQGATQMQYFICKLFRFSVNSFLSPWMFISTKQSVFIK